MQDLATIKIRCSSIGYIMTEPKSAADKKAGALSETAKGHLSDLFVRTRYGRKTDHTNKYTIKGNLVEEDSLTLYSQYKNSIFFKNKEQLQNDFITGTPDIIKPELIIDIKSSWDIFTFFRNNDAGRLNKQYYWQLQGYMALTGAKKAVLAYCLVNTPDSLIADEKRRLFYRFDAATVENTEYVAACDEIEKLSIYDDIPLTERVIEQEIERDDEAINSIYEKVKTCREFMKHNYARFGDSILITPTQHGFIAESTI